MATCLGYYLKVFKHSAVLFLFAQILDTPNNMLLTEWFEHLPENWHEFANCFSYWLWLLILFVKFLLLTDSVDLYKDCVSYLSITMYMY